MHLLIIEDEARVSQFLKKGFQAEAFTVDVAKDGESGLSLALSGQYDAIILDLMLPGMSGLDILKQLRADGVDTPILILTARGDVEDRVKGLNLGADDYLPKPFSFAELLARTRSLTRRGAGTIEQSPILELADLRVDQMTRLVSRAGHTIDLSNKEYTLLVYLLRSKGRVLSRVLIMDHIWGVDFDTGTNIVDVVINRLRRKIDDGFSPPLIHTVRGVGYVMREQHHAPSE